MLEFVIMLYVQKMMTDVSCAQTIHQTSAMVRVKKKTKLVFTYKMYQSLREKKMEKLSTKTKNSRLQKQQYILVSEQCRERVLLPFQKVLLRRFERRMLDSKSRVITTSL